MRRGDQKVAPPKWNGPKYSFDPLKGLAIALASMTILIVSCALLFSSPDVRAVTLEDWAQAEPTDFVMTSIDELAGTSSTAKYGAPYNYSSEGQSLGPLKLQKLFGVHIPIQTAEDFVVEPLEMSLKSSAFTALEQWTGANTAQQRKLVTEYVALQRHGLSAALAQWNTANTNQRMKWLTWYKMALGKASDPSRVVSDLAFGPVQAMTGSLLALAQSGVLDGSLTTESSPFQMNFTKELLFLSDSKYMDELATQHHLGLRQQSLVNETGSYPGEFWLTSTTLLYQFEPFKSSKNDNAEVFALRMLLMLVLIFLPKIPILNAVPRWIPLHRLIWRGYYKKHKL
jgi:hypothetical protein